MMIMICGDVGTGKTLMATLFAYLEKSSIIYANYELKLPNYIPLDISAFMNSISEKQSLVIIDEAYLSADSRTSMAIGNLMQSYLAFQHRKRHCNLIVVCQDIGSIDCRIRARIDLLIKALKHDSHNFHYLFYNTHSRSEKFKALSVELAQRLLYPLYDTYAIVKSRSLDVALNSFTALEDLEETVKKEKQAALDWLTEKGMKITKSNVKSYCVIKRLCARSEFVDLLYAEIQLLIVKVQESLSELNETE